MVGWLHSLLVEVELVLERSDLFGVRCLLDHVLDIIYALLLPFLISHLGTLLPKLRLSLQSKILDFLLSHLNLPLKESLYVQSRLLFHPLLFELRLLLQPLPFKFRLLLYPLPFQFRLLLHFLLF